jgi:hypothetical protein
MYSERSILAIAKSMVLLLVVFLLVAPQVMGRGCTCGAGNYNDNSYQTPCGGSCNVLPSQCSPGDGSDCDCGFMGTGCKRQYTCHQCKPCPPGTYTDKGDQVDSCMSCPAGKYSGSGASVCITCPVGKKSEPGSNMCTACNQCQDPNSRMVTQCTATSETVCACKVGYYSLDGGMTCNPCTKSCDEGQVTGEKCTSTSDLVCQTVTQCKSASGDLSSCLSPQTCFACAAQSSKSSSTSVGVSGSQGATSGSLTAGQNTQQSASVKVGICCDTNNLAQNCNQYCKTSQGLRRTGGGLRVVIRTLAISSLLWAVINSSIRPGIFIINFFY